MRRLVELSCSVPGTFAARGKVGLAVAHAVPRERLGADRTLSLCDVSVLIGHGCGAVCLNWRRESMGTRSFGVRPMFLILALGCG